MTTPGGAGTRYVTYSNNPPVLGAPASIIGSELPRARLRPLALPRPDKTCSYQDDQGQGSLRGVPAFIMLALLAALFPTSVLLQRGLRFATTTGGGG
jgi:hypothetical protein